ncbi:MULTISPECIES: phage tail tape measure protein [Phyllobacteriaceae]|nr:MULTISPECIES: phage tail tape measure protein [Mesorhizobium]MBN9232773.1 phage tail tape measure protein [Mesorhizobium sp.]MDQ0330373.1 disulfide bond formation protein DsbB [Mesorhizobium sp. YL-MeA3-2017]
MSGRSMALDVLVRLRDHLSGPLRSLKNNLSSLVGFARKIGVLGAAVAGISFMGPIQEAAAFQQKLLDIAGTAELTGKAAFAFVDQAEIRYDALAFKIGQHSDTIADGVGQMIAAGVNPKLIDATIGDIGRATTAANASFADMSGVGISMLNNLKLPADQMRDSLGALVVAGKLGSFELKDMAASFPNLTSGVAKFGVKGREAVNFLASALQIARKGTADPATAANNLANFLDKALAPLTKKNFEKHGVDIEAVMMDAAAKGMNPIEAVIQKIGKLTGVNETQIAGFMKKAKQNGLEGAEALGYVRQQLEAIGAAGKVGELFQDKQVLDFLVPFLANIDEYKDIKSKVAAATGAITDADFDTQMAGINRQLTIFREVGTQAVRFVGMAFAQWLPTLNEWAIAALGWLREFDASSGGMATKMLVFAGAGLGVAAALGVLGFVLPIVGAGLAAIGALIGIILSPIGLLIAALAGGAAFIWKNWDRFGPRLMRLWDRAKQGFRSLAGDVVDRGRRIIDAGRDMVSQYGPMIQRGFERAWAGAEFAGSKFLGGFQKNIAGIGDSFSRYVSAVVEDFRILRDIGSNIGQIVSNVFAGSGIDWGKVFGDIGGFVGGQLKQTADDFVELARSVGDVLKAIREITNALATGEPIPWSKIMPDGVVAAYEKVVIVISQVKAALTDFAAWLSKFSLPTINLNPFGAGSSAKTGDVLPNGTPAGDPNKVGPSGMPEDRERALQDFTVPPVRPPANNNKQSSLQPAASSRFAAIAAPVRQDVNVGGAVRIVVDGPAKVASVASDNAAVPVQAGSGRMVGRV